MSAEDIDAFINDAIGGAADDDGGEELVDEVDDAVVEEGGADDDSAVEDAQAELIAGKFKDVAALEKAYKELERQFHQSRQPQPETEVEDDGYDDDGYDDVVTMPLPLGGEPQTTEQLWGWVEQSPQDAALWTIQNADRLPPELTKQVVDAWANLDPTGHAMFVAESRAAAAAQAYEERIARLEQQLQPHNDRLHQDFLNTVRAAGEQAIPDQAERQAALEMIQQTPYLMAAWQQAQAERDVNSLVGIVRLAHRNIAFDRFQQQQAALAAQQPAPQQPQRSRAATRTRQGATPAPDPAGDEATAIVNAANAAHRGW